MNVTDYCAKVDETEKAAKIAGTSAAYEEFTKAKNDLVAHVKNRMEKMRSHDGSPMDCVSTLSYFNSWCLLRGGFDP